jgi:malonyl-CoA O-methyltransferase
MPSERFKNSIAKGFSDAASTYDHWSMLQQQVARRLATMLPEEPPHGLILDVGCGTGALTELLHAQYPAGRILGIDIAPGMVDACKTRWAGRSELNFEVADAERYLPSEPCGLVASSFSVQWLSQIAVGHMAAWLAPHGQMAIAVPVKGSLPELREAYRAIVGSPLWGTSLPTGADYLKWLSQAGLTCRIVQTETFRDHFDDARQVLHSFKGIGATFRYQEGYTPLTPTATRELLCYYDQHFAGADGRVPVTYEVLLFVAEKAS